MHQVSGDWISLDRTIDSGLVPVPIERCADIQLFTYWGSSPLALDLDGDGIQLTAPEVPFDLAARGAPALIPALGADDGLLVLDQNGNGEIDSGAELFGTATVCGSGRCLDGIEALAQHALNHDRRIDAGDPLLPSGSG